MDSSEQEGLSWSLSDRGEDRARSELWQVERPTGLNCASFPLETGG